MIQSAVLSHMILWNSISAMRCDYVMRIYICNASMHHVIQSYRTLYDDMRTHYHHHNGISAQRIALLLPYMHSHSTTSITTTTTTTTTTTGTQNNLKESRRNSHQEAVLPKLLLVLFPSRLPQILRLQTDRNREWLQIYRHR